MDTDGDGQCDVEEFINAIVKVYHDELLNEDGSEHIAFNGGGANEKSKIIQRRGTETSTGTSIIVADAAPEQSVSGNTTASASANANAGGIQGGSRASFNGYVQQMKSDIGEARTDKSKCKVVLATLLWVITQFFLVLFGITALVDAAQESNPGQGFQAIWIMLLGVVLAVGGSLILCKPDKYKTRNSYGVFIGMALVMSNWMLCQAAAAGGADVQSLVSGCSSMQPTSVGYTKWVAQQSCMGNCSVTFPKANIPGTAGAAKKAGDVAAMTTAQIAAWLGEDAACILALTRRAIVAFSVILFLLYAGVAAVLYVGRDAICPEPTGDADEHVG
jgi:hypothetical protein